MSTMTGLSRILVVALALTGCADLSASPSSRYDGVYELSSKPVAGYESVCPSDKLTVAVVDGRLTFTVHPPDEWRGFIDRDGYFHGESAYGTRSFKLTDGVDVPGAFSRNAYEGCQYHYQFASKGKPPVSD